LEDALFIPAGFDAILDAIFVIHLESHLAVFIPFSDQPIEFTVFEVVLTLLFTVGKTNVSISRPAFPGYRQRVRTDAF
jgi:hypothetical protein